MSFECLSVNVLCINAFMNKMFKSLMCKCVFPVLTLPGDLF